MSVSKAKDELEQKLCRMDLEYAMIRAEEVMEICELLDGKSDEYRIAFWTGYLLHDRTTQAILNIEGGTDNEEDE